MWRGNLQLSVIYRIFNQRVNIYSLWMQKPCMTTELGKWMLADVTFTEVHLFFLVKPQMAQSPRVMTQERSLKLFKLLVANYNTRYFYFIYYMPDTFPHILHGYVIYHVY